jgi:hypothetical protein
VKADGGLGRAVALAVGARTGERGQPLHVKLGMGVRAHVAAGVGIPVDVLAGRRQVGSSKPFGTQSAGGAELANELPIDAAVTRVAPKALCM